MNKDKLQTIALVLITVISGSLIIFFLARTLIPVFSPFFIAWGIAFAVRSPAKAISKKMRIPEGIIRVFIAVFVTLFAFGILALLIWQFSGFLWKILVDIGEGNAIFSFFEAVGSPGLPFLGDVFPEELSVKLTEAINSVIEGLLRNLGEAVTSWASLLPGALLFLLVTLISSVYFCIDLEKINSSVKRLLPEKVTSVLSSFRASAFSMIFKYVSSYLIILFITFVVMLIGFLLLGVSSATPLAVIVSILDILPIIGVGTVLLPWSIFSFAVGDISRGVGLVVLFVINTVIRQFSEPRIVGKSIDLHPVLTLVFIYCGYALFGIVGIALVPIFAVIVGLVFKNKSSAKIGERSSAERNDL